jgi:glycerate-2-kinase
MKPSISRLARSTFDYALRAVAPAELVRSAVKLDASSGSLRVSGRHSSTSIAYDLKKSSNILILGAGKASQELCHGLLAVLGDSASIGLDLSVHAMINIPEGQKVRHSSYQFASSGLGFIRFEAVTPQFFNFCRSNEIFSRSVQLIPYEYGNGVSVEFMETSHPLPNAATFSCTTRQLDAIRSAPKHTLMIALLSGGGSSLFESMGGTNIGLEDVRQMNRLLIESGASITEISILFTI